MARLEEITVGRSVKGVLPDGLVTAVAVEWIGSVAINITYRDSSGKLGSELLYRDREPTLEVAAMGRPWSFDGDGALFRLLSEAHRIRLAYLFDPLLAVHTSFVEPLPHQITAVYGEMLPRQPLRFLLADDPGAGKTIMTGLFVKELSVRGDLQRCLIVCPGNLAEQWQDELDRRFHLPFEIMTNDKLESARTGNWFLEHPLVICRLDKLSRDLVVQASRLKSEESQDGQLRLAVEPQPVGTAFRPYSPHRADGGLPSLEPGGQRHARRRSLLSLARKTQRRRVRRSAARCSMCWARLRSTIIHCAS